MFGVYRENDNYKLQGLALWNAVALVEFAILDLLGRLAGRSMRQPVFVPQAGCRDSV